MAFFDRINKYTIYVIVTIIDNINIIRYIYIYIYNRNY